MKKFFEAMKNMSKDDKIDFIENCMPSGSGFNTDYFITEKNKCYVVKSSYQVMNENGCYEGWIHFTVYIWKDIPCNKGKKMTFHINGKVSHYLAKKYFLRDYLLEDIYECIRYKTMEKLKKDK